MKNLFQTLKVLFVAVIPYLLHSKLTFLPGAAPHIELPPITDLSPLLSNLPALAATLLTWYEVLVRLVPTVRNYSLVSLFVAFLQALVPNKAVLPDGSQGEFVASPGLVKSCLNGVLHLFTRKPVAVAQVAPAAALSYGAAS